MNTQPTRLTRANTLLAEQHSKLSAVIASSAPAEVKSMAQHYLASVLHWQSRPEAARDMALGEMGGNGKGPAIDDVVAQAEFHARRAAAGMAVAA